MNSQLAVAHWVGCCRHVKELHDQHGCTIDVSTTSRCYYRCHDDEQPALDPRWRDFHTLPDERLHRWIFRGKSSGYRPWVKRIPWLWRAAARYSIRHFHCEKDGQCVFRAGHRGCCYWGDDDDE
jgi:hypothetical protein